MVTVTARDGRAQPMRNLSLRVGDPRRRDAGGFRHPVGAQRGDGLRGRATFVYTAALAGGLSRSILLVDIVVTPIGTDFNNAIPRTAAIRLVPQGPVSSADQPGADFTVTPAAPTDNQTVLFDASREPGPRIARVSAGASATAARGAAAPTSTATTKRAPTSSR